jgi:hypothetical protein
MVGVARIELATPAMSTQCSTTELHAHAAIALAPAREAGNPVRLELAGVWGCEHPIDFQDEIAQVKRL